MSDLRKAAEMALEALERELDTRRCKESSLRAMNALRQALAQSEQDELLKQGWRQCAVGQRTTQYCGMAEQARLEEREACAKVCDLVAKEIDDTNGIATYCAAAIRARGEK